MYNLNLNLITLTVIINFEFDKLIDQFNAVACWCYC